MTDDLSRLGATDQAGLVRSGQASPAELEQARPWAERVPPILAA